MKLTLLALLVAASLTGCGKTSLKYTAEEYTDLCRKSAELAEGMSLRRSLEDISTEDIQAVMIQDSKDERLGPTLAYALDNVGHDAPRAYVYTFKHCIADTATFASGKYTPPFAAIADMIK